MRERWLGGGVIMLFVVFVTVEIISFEKKKKLEWINLSVAIFARCSGVVSAFIPNREMKRVV